MARLGRKDGLDYYLTLLKWPPRQPKEPFPAVSDREMPPVVRLVKEGIAERDMAAFKHDFHEEEDATSRRIAQLRERLDQLRDAEYVPATHKTSALGYVLFLLILAIGDFVLGRSIFAMMGSSRGDTALMAGVIAVTTPAAAHFLGTFAKKRLWIGVAVALLAAVGVATVIAVFRSSYLEGTGVIQALGLQMAPGTLSALFWILQASIFMVAGLASWHHTVADPDGEERSREKESISQELRDAEERLASLPSLYEGMADEINSTWQGLAAAYHTANMTARSRVDVTPPVWPQYLSEIPKSVFTRRVVSGPWTVPTLVGQSTSPAPVISPAPVFGVSGSPEVW